VSIVHAFPSSMTRGVPALHTPEPSHVSSPLQTFPSEQDVPATAGECVTPCTGSQESTVHALPSSRTSGVPTLHTPPPSQSSMPLHTFPSEHDAPADAGTWRTPAMGSHVSVVHALPSSTTRGVPALHTPAPSHVSRPLQMFPSEHDVPPAAGAWRIPLTGSQLSTVQGFPSSTETEACTHVLPDQVSSVQAFPSLQLQLHAPQVRSVRHTCAALAHPLSLQVRVLPVVQTVGTSTASCAAIKVASMAPLRPHTNARTAMPNSRSEEQTNSYMGSIDGQGRTASSAIRQRSFDPLLQLPWRMTSRDVRKPPRDGAASVNLLLIGLRWDKSALRGERGAAPS